MPASVTAQSRYRARREAIGRKAWYESEFFMEDSDGLQPHSHDTYPSKKVVAPTPTTPTSPTSVSSTFELMPEVQPITLPDAWVVVGKGGRPLKNVKMYDEPKQLAKKKRVRARNKIPSACNEDDESLFLTRLEEAPSSSKCVQQFERSARQHGKQVTRSLDAKKWARYRQNKQAVSLANITALMLSDADATEGTLTITPQPTKSRHFANSHAEKTRRRAHAHERCYWPETEDEVMPAAPQSMARARGVAARDGVFLVEEEKKTPTTTVPVVTPELTAHEQAAKGKGKQGATPEPTAHEQAAKGKGKQGAIPEPTTHEQAAKPGKGKGKQSNCSVM